MNETEIRPSFEIEKYIEEFIAVIEDAGRAIMEVYDTDFDVEIKDDNSPLTLADHASHAIFLSGLKSIMPDVPVISEEDGEARRELTEQILQTEQAYFVVDPLDGTREFVARSGQFCPGFALIVDGKPYFGMYSVPTQGVIYYGGPTIGSFKKVGDGPAESIHVAGQSTGKVLASRIDKGGPTAEYVQQHYDGFEIVSFGSMMKFGMLAEGGADAYPCIDRPLKLWDLAAGHAIVEGAGGIVTRPDGGPIDYRNQTLLAGDFVARSAV